MVIVVTKLLLYFSLAVELFTTSSATKKCHEFFAEEFIKGQVNEEAACVYEKENDLCCQIDDVSKKDREFQKHVDQVAQGGREVGDDEEHVNGYDHLGEILFGLCDGVVHISVGIVSRPQPVRIRWQSGI